MLSLRALTIANIDEVFAVYADLPRFFTLLTGEPAVPRAYVEEEISVGPPGHEKMFLGVYEGAELLGVVDILPSYPTVGRAWIGVFLIAERHHRRGLGRAGVALVENLARERGALEVSLGVELVNTSGRAFWAACGYRPTGEQFETEVLGKALRAEVLRKQL